MDERDLIEQLADLEHDRWSRWMKYLLSKCEIVKTTGEVIIPKWAVVRWTRQLNTPYSELSEREKESDREEARDVLELPAIKHMLELEEENAKLREALEQIYQGAEGNSGRCMDCDAIKQIASQALNPKPAAYITDDEDDGYLD